MIAQNVCFPPHLTCFLPDANTNGADQPVHLHSLISTFIVNSQDSKISIGFIYKRLSSQDLEYSIEGIRNLSYHSIQTAFYNVDI